MSTIDSAVNKDLCIKGLDLKTRMELNEFLLKRQHGNPSLSTIPKTENCKITDLDIQGKEPDVPDEVTRAPDYDATNRFVFSTSALRHSEFQMRHVLHYQQFNCTPKAESSF